VRHEGGGNLDNTTVIAWLRDQLNGYNGELVGAHILYDLEHLSAPPWSIDFSQAKLRDVLLAEVLIDEWRKSYSLDAVLHYHGMGGKDERILQETAMRNGWGNVKNHLWQLPATFVGDYAEGDVNRLLLLHDTQMGIMKKQGLLDVYEVECGLIPLLLAMRRHGVRIDQNAIEQAEHALGAQLDHHLNRARDLAGCPLEVMAPESFVRALEKRGLYPPTTPRTGKPSITKSWLEAYSNDALVKEILAARKYEKMLNTFIDGTKKYIVTRGSEARIYPEFPQLKRSEDGEDDDDGNGKKSGTIARFSCRHPNLQQQPSRDPELSKVIRGFFIPEPDCHWERHDMSQIEFRLLVHYARGQGALEALEAYRNDPETDFHKLAARMFGADPENPHERSRVKNTNFAKVYSAGVERLALTFGCTVEEARVFSEEYDRKLPFVGVTGRAARDKAQACGFVLTVLGRRQRFNMWECIENRRLPWLPEAKAREQYGNHNVRRAFTHAALNRVLQGSAADVFKSSLANIWRSGICSILGAPLINVHDENNWSVPQSPEAEEAIAEARHLMETSIRLRVPLLVNWERGSNWGECK
jgi:DNA polymerase I-like protein with 3'-5' exonuclease and polymerase domains